MTTFRRIFLTTLALLASAPQLSFAHSPLLAQARALFKPIPDTARAVPGETATAAIGAFEATLLTPNAPFDQYLRGDENALNVRQEAIAVMASSQLGQALNEEEVASIEAFLLSLTGEQPQVIYPTLPPSTVDTPEPVI